MAELKETRNGFYFDPSAKGLAVFLGPTESEVMEILWKKGPLTAKRLQLFLENGPQRAHTTIITILTNLASKGLLAKQKESRQFVFSPVSTKEAFVSERIEIVTECLKRNFPSKK